MDDHSFAVPRQVDTANCNVEDVYRDVIGEFSTYKNDYNLSLHWVIPTPILHASPLVSDGPPHNSPFPFRANRPVPHMPPANINPAALKRGDPFDVLLKNKYEWEQELHSLIKFARKDKKWAGKEQYSLNTGKVKKKDEGQPIYSVHSYVEVARHLAKDPTPHFSGSHNWLTTGGCMSHCTVGDQPILLFPTGPNMDILRVTLKTKGETWNCEQSKQLVDLTVAENQQIYQVVSKGGAKKGLAAIRQEQSCSIVQIKSNSNQELTARSVLEVQEEDAIYTNIDICHHQNRFCTIDSDYALKLWDLSSSSVTLSAQISAPEINAGNWGVVKFTDNPHEILISNKTSVLVKDLRAPLTDNIQEFNPGPIVDDCEKLCMIFSSQRGPYVYAATSHRLLTLDTRSGWIQRWTHLLRAPPVFGCSQYFSGDMQELVVLSSCAPGDTIAVINTWENGAPNASILPATLPSVGDSMLWAQSKGECLDTSLATRLEMSTAGLALYPSGDKFTLTKVTCIGDVFSQDLAFEWSQSGPIEAYSSSSQNESDLTAWKQWEEAHMQTCMNNYPPLCCQPTNANTLFDAIKAPLKKDKKILEQVKSWQSTFNICDQKKMRWNGRHINWERMYRKDSPFKDLMAGVLLEAWDFDEQSNKSETDFSYVKQWLDCTMPETGNVIDESARSETSLSIHSTRNISKLDQTQQPDESARSETSPSILSTRNISKLDQTQQPKTKKMKKESEGF